MCLAPILIDNPYYNSPIRAPDFLALHDTKSTKMAVPCGICASCIHLKQVYLIQRVQMEALNNDLFYGTLTYNQQSLPKAKYGDITFAYPDYSDWQKMLKMIRKDYPNLKFKYFLVSEYGGVKHRPHYHFILSLPRSDVGASMAEKISKAYELFNIFLQYWRRNYGSTRKPIWQPLLTYVNRGGKYNYDLHYLDPNSSVDGLDGVSFYVTKYILKFDDWVQKFKSVLFYNLSYEDYKKAFSQFRPRLLLSKFFGSPYDPDVASHIRKGIHYSVSDSSAFFPYYLSKQNGTTYPLAPYYSKRFLDVDSAIILRSRIPESYLTEDDFHRFDVGEERLSKQRKFLNAQSPEYEFDDIDNINLFEYGILKTPLAMDNEFADSWKDF